MKLNLGCGNKKKEGFLGIDRFPCEAVNVISDITNTLPFLDGSVEEVWMDNVIEHVLDIPLLMSEIHRVAKKDAEITILTPHFASSSSWRDPTHVHHLSYFSMDHFKKKSVSHYMRGGFKVVKRRLSFAGVMGNIGRFLFKLSPKQYEAKWCFIFRPSTLKFILTVNK